MGIIKELYKSANPAEECGSVFIRLFAHYRTPRKLAERLRELTTYFIIDTDSSIADYGFFSRLFELGSKHKNRMLLCGNDHALKMLEILRSMNWQLVDGKRLRADKTNNVLIESAIAHAKDLLLKRPTIKKVSIQSCCAKCSAKPEKPQRCSRCKNIRYCSVACQKADWERHKKDCKVQDTPQTDKP